MSELITFAEFCTIRKYLSESCGLCFEDDKYPRISGIVGSRMAELGVASFPEYHRILLARQNDKTEIVKLGARLTVGETHFFRNVEHWRAMSECVLPWIIEQNASSGKRHIRVWSAGCSSGEEAYTASMVIRKNLPDAVKWNIEIVGTDISPKAVELARQAVYSENSFRGVSRKIVNEYFDHAGKNRYRLHDDIRSTVRFEEMNLLDRTAMSRMRDFDVIFCRNVLIYFDNDSIRQVLSNFRRILKPGGYLFLGHSESLHGNVPGFACMHACDTFIYKIIPLVSDYCEYAEPVRSSEDIHKSKRHKDVCISTVNAKKSTQCDRDRTAEDRESNEEFTTEPSRKSDLNGCVCDTVNDLSISSDTRATNGSSASARETTNGSSTIFADVNKPIVDADGNNAPNSSANSTVLTKLAKILGHGNSNCNTTPKNIDTASIASTQHSNSCQFTRDDTCESQRAPSSITEEAVEPTVNMLRDQGVRLLLDQNYSQAKQTFQQIIDREPRNATCLLYMALAVAESGGNKTALELCDRILQLQPLCAEAYYVKALVYEELGEDTTALAELNKAVYLDGSFAMAHFRMAGLYDRAERCDDARRQYVNTLKMLREDDEQRVQLFSGGFDTTTITQTCERRLGVEMTNNHNKEVESVT